jgi:hypothetical protein
MELRGWVNDPQNGIASVKIDLFWGLWKKFRDIILRRPIPNWMCISRLFLKQGFGPGQKEG